MAPQASFSPLPASQASLLSSPLLLLSYVFCLRPPFVLSMMEGSANHSSSSWAPPLRSECEALQDLYLSTNGPTTWRNRSGWEGAGGDCCGWYGVTCAGEGSSLLLEVDLFDNGLQGPLPASLGRLGAGLQVLVLAQNRLAGPLPASLGNLTGLRELDLAQNRLSGPLPPGLQRLAQLEEVLLFHNQLSGRLEPWWGRLLKLRRLVLSHNLQLGGPIPDVFYMMPRLQVGR